MQRTAIVTGAARGIGAAVAKRLARDGCAVAVVDLVEADCAETVDAITAAGGRAIGIGADVSDEDAVVGAVARTVAELGAPTVLVNNAGYARDANIEDMTTEMWDDVFGVHMRGAFFTTRAVRPYMVDAGWGRIINVSSISALGHAGRVNYSAAKAGIIGFTKALANELGPYGVTANVIAPGFIVSAMTAKTAKRLGLGIEEHQRCAAKEIPVGRVGQPEDIAHAAGFFASAEAAFTSGQVLYVAGGPRD